MADRRAYPSDLSDARWELIEPVPSAWRYERHGRALGFGRPPEHDLREIMNAILYVDRTGVQWRYLSHDFPNWNTVYGYFAKWQSHGQHAGWSVDALHACTRVYGADGAVGLEHGDGLFNQRPDLCMGPVDG